MAIKALTKNTLNPGWSPNKAISQLEETPAPKSTQKTEEPKLDKLHTNPKPSSKSIPAENKILSFDLNDTLIAHNYKDDSNFVQEAEAQGYKIYELKEGMHFVLRHGAKEMFQKLTKEGFQLIVCTNDRGDYAKKILEQTGLMPFVNKLIDFNDLMAAESSNYPRHPNNKASGFQVFKDWIYRYSIDLIRNFFLYLQSFTNPNIHTDWSTPVNKGKKYPPMYNSHILFDNSAKHTENSQWSGDWMHIKVENLKDKILKKEDDKQWLDGIYKVTDKLKQESWQVLAR